MQQNAPRGSPVRTDRTRGQTGREDPASPSTGLTWSPPRSRTPRLSQPYPAASSTYRTLSAEPLFAGRGQRTLDSRGYQHTSPCGKNKGFFIGRPPEFPGGKRPSRNCLGHPAGSVYTKARVPCCSACENMIGRTSWLGLDPLRIHDNHATIAREHRRSCEVAGKVRVDIDVERS